MCHYTSDKRYRVRKGRKGEWRRRDRKIRGGTGEKQGGKRGGRAGRVEGNEGGISPPHGHF